MTDLKEDFYQKMRQGFKTTPDYVPTGIIDPAIIAMGQGEHKIILIQTTNKCGKTAGWVTMLRELMWVSDNKYFQLPIFQNWPYPKRIRIAATSQNVMESGPIWEEINKWWPSRYTKSKQGKLHFSYIETDNGWQIDIMTFDQDPSQFEGPIIGLWVMDEPGKAWMIGAMNSRMSKGGIGIPAFTPMKGAPAVIDTLDDLEAKGMRMVKITGTADENHIETGKPNRFGEKRGLLTTEELEDYKRSIPVYERDQRLEGKSMAKAGRIFPNFNRDAHVLNLSLSQMIPELKESDLYMVYDPHRKYYPYMSWWVCTPDERYICWNEWPDFSELGDFYDILRNTAICPYSDEQLATFIKILSGMEDSLNIRDYLIDPRFAKGTEGESGRQTGSIVMSFAKHGINFTLPPFELIEAQRTRISELLHYDTAFPPIGANAPRLYILKHCVNTIRAFERHYWEEGKEKEAEDYKDPIDCARYFLSHVTGFERKKQVAYDPKVDYEEFQGIVKPTDLSG